MNSNEQKIEMEEECTEQIVGTEKAQMEKEQIEEMVEFCYYFKSLIQSNLVIFFNEQQKFI